MRLTMTWVCVAVMLGTASLVGGRADDAPDAAVSQFLSGDDVPLTSYRALRRMRASTRGGAMHATLTAWTSQNPDTGFQYSIVDESGSGVIRGRVLRAALEAEQQMHARNELPRGALSAQNYTFGPAVGDADGLLRVPIHPTRKDTMLVDGTMALTGAGDLISVTGVLVKRPSFWTRRVEVQRHYARIAGVRVPVRMQSIASVLIVGKSEFEVTYEYESVNGRSAGSVVP